MQSNDKLCQLRKILKNYQMDAYFIPHNDAHQSEYIADCDERLQHISGFSGSAGVGLVLKDEAHLWTDSRYWLQAEKQLENGWVLKKMQPGYPNWQDVAMDKLSENSIIAFDPLLLTKGQYENLKNHFDKKRILFAPISENLVDAVWDDKPQLPQNLIFEHEVQYAGESVQQKLESVRKIVIENKCQFLLTSKLDEIAWVLNLRGNDISYNPVFFSYLLIDFTQEKIKAQLFIEKIKIPENVQAYLTSNNIEILQYDDIFDIISQFNHQKCLVNENACNIKILSLFQNEYLYKNVPNVIDGIKETKNKREIQGMYDCHVRDGVALCGYLAWLQKEILVNKNLNEFQAASKAEQFRRAMELNMGLSFSTISSVGSNAAIIHYKPQENQSSLIKQEQIYLVDSGGQYLDGTTDVTRTVHMGSPSDEEKDAYTRVLLGNLDIERLIWPKKNLITGSDIDILARRRLWQNYMDYGHGTGHGVGYFLNVHEGPTGISKRCQQVIREGNVLSNEPGYYKDGYFGIRIENLIIVKKAEQDGFLMFEPLTLCPYEKNLIDMKQLTQNDKDHINAYHKRCLESLKPGISKLEDAEYILKWLKEKTSPI